MNTEIRELTTEDYNQFVRITFLALETNPEAFTTSAVGEKSEVIKARFDAAMNRAGHFILGMYDTDSGELISVVGFSKGEMLHTNHKGMIWVLYTQPEFRGKGFATQLCRAVIERSKKLKDLEQIKVAVHSRNEDAVHLFQQFSFEVTGTEKNAFKKDKEYWDLIHMIRLMDGKK